MIRSTYGRERKENDMSVIITAFVGPISGRVSPYFLEEQRDRSTADEEDAEVVQDVEG